MIALVFTAGISGRPVHTALFHGFSCAVSNCAEAVQSDDVSPETSSLELPCSMCENSLRSAHLHFYLPQSGIGADTAVILSIERTAFFAPRFEYFARCRAPPFS